MTTPTASLLLVDDEPFNLEILSAYLEDDGYDITTAMDGKVAMDLLLDEPDHFDVVLLDRRMPRQDGMQVLHHMKKHPDLNAIPVIMQTAASTSREIIEGLEAGSYYYLTKPYQREMLVPIVRGAVSDRLRFKTLQRNLTMGNRSLGLMKSAEFQVRTLDEAQNLAVSLANACPNPTKAVLGITELMVNAVEHGNLGITYEEKSRLMEEGRWLEEVEKRVLLPGNRNKYVQVQMQTSESELRIRITDCGPGFDWEKYLQLDPARVFDSHGRGIAISNALSLENIEYLPPGNSVVITVPVKPSRRAPGT